jgi:hypothetical protein
MLFFQILVMFKMSVDYNAFGKVACLEGAWSGQEG